MEVSGFAVNASVDCEALLPVLSGVGRCRWDKLLPLDPQHCGRGLNQRENRQDKSDDCQRLRVHRPI